MSLSADGAYPPRKGSKEGGVSPAPAPKPQTGATSATAGHAHPPPREGEGQGEGLNQGDREGQGAASSPPKTTSAGPGRTAPEPSPKPSPEQSPKQSPRLSPLKTGASKRKLKAEDERRGLVLWGMLARRTRIRDFFTFGLSLAVFVVLGLQVGWITFPGAIVLGVAACVIGALRFRFAGAQALVPSDAARAAEDVVQDVQPSQVRGEDLLWLADSHPEPLLLLDGDNRIVLANLASHAVVGHKATGKLIATVLRHASLQEALEEVRATGKATEVEYITPVPVERRYKAQLRPMPVELAGSGSAEGKTPVMIVLNDQTAFRRLERMRVDFIANASHELRTPLASLTGFIDTLQGAAREDDEVRDGFLRIMAEQAARMGRLVDDLTSLSRIELNEHLQPRELVAVDHAVGDVIDALQPLAQERGVSLEVENHAAQEGPFRVLGDRDELIQVFQNLVENGIKYGASGKRLSVSLGMKAVSADFHQSLGNRVVLEGRFSPGQYCTVTVRDQGPGIGSDHLSRLTERFYRVNSEASHAVGGTGLGLAIVKHIVNRHRGLLIIASEEGEGSAFTVMLPAVEEDQRPADHEAPASEPAPAN